jgi:hypothetical protein
MTCQDCEARRRAMLALYDRMAAAIRRNRYATSSITLWPVKQWPGRSRQLANRKRSYKSSIADD